MSRTRRRKNCVESWKGVGLSVGAIGDSGRDPYGFDAKRPFNFRLHGDGMALDDRHASVCTWLPGVAQILGFGWLWPSYPIRSIPCFIERSSLVTCESQVTS